MVQVILQVALNTTKQLEQIVKNTEYDWMPGFIISLFALFAGITSAIYAYLTYKSQKDTELNTSRLNPDEQRLLLIGMLRHLYRNFVISYSINVKMKAKDFMVYPSEEHLKKMQVVLTDIHLNLFYRSDEKYHDMNKLYMELRNYNMELDVICNHFRNPDIDIETKKRDLRTLCFKCDYLTKRITNLIGKIWYQDETSFHREARHIIVEETKEKNKMPGDSYTESFEPYNNVNSFYAKELFANEPDTFFNGLNENVRHECGTNSEGAEKIHMISL
ncbi:MAG: hypothetical protein J1E57_11960 [Prevotella sp.]|nr:hypothetical protein [Prevotella sp.]